MNEPKIDPLIQIVRGQRVILDADLAALYGVPTKQFNQALKRNRKRFPAEFAFRLAPKEALQVFADQNIDHRESSDVTQHPTDEYVRPIRSQIVTSYSQDTHYKRVRKSHRTATYRPWAFTEHGALMAATILQSDRAHEMSVFIIRAFVKMREEIASNQAMLRRFAAIDKTLIAHDAALRELYEKLQPLFEPPPEVEKQKIGFHPGNR